MRDTVLLAVVVLGFAALVTVHVLLVGGLYRRRPRWRALLSLVIFPLAPYFGVRERMWVRSIAWLLFATAYAIARVMASA